MIAKLPNPTSPEPGEPGHDEETAHRRFHALVSFVEVGSSLSASDPEGNLHRQLLLAAMGATGAECGGILLGETPTTARLVDAFGTSRRRDDPTTIQFTGDCRSGLLSGRQVQFLSPDERKQWRRLLKPILPSLEPATVVRLAIPDSPCSCLVLGGAGADLHSGDDERAVLRTLARLSTVFGERVAAATATPCEKTRDEPAGAMAGDLEELRGQHPVLKRFVGSSAVIRQNLSDLVGVATTSCPLLIEGSSGTGKELVARIAHEISCAHEAPFEAVSCAAIPETLMESELFGHVSGSFTGATRDHRGVFDRAKGGTVFLDEIGDMPASAQVKLLRVLQEGTYLPVGGEQLRHCKSRVIAATNCDLRSLVKSGQFRADLYYRLNVFPIRLPPLLERRDDLPLLLRHFLTRHADEMGRPAPALQTEAMRRLVAYSYPGNVRELQNVVRALLVESRGTREITDDDVIAVFSRHRVDEREGMDIEMILEDEPGDSQDHERVGAWVRDELRRHYFNIALTERMLEQRRQAEPGASHLPVHSRSGLTYYLQGECLRMLAQEGWDCEAAARRIAGKPELLPRMRSKLDRFVEEALRTLRDGGDCPERRLGALQQRFGKLPACYADDLRRFAEAFETGVWSPAAGRKRPPVH